MQYWLFHYCPGLLRRVVDHAFMTHDACPPHCTPAATGSTHAGQYEYVWRTCACNYVLLSCRWQHPSKGTWLSSPRWLSQFLLHPPLPHSLSTHPPAASRHVPHPCAVPGAKRTCTSQMTMTGWSENCDMRSLMSRSASRSLGPVLYHPTIFSRAAKKCHTQACHVLIPIGNAEAQE